MKRPSRVTTAILLTFLLIGGMTVYAVTRLMKWDEMGIVGLTYMQYTPGVKKQVRIFGMSPGDVVMGYPDSPATRADIRSRDHIVSIDGIGIENVPALRALDARLGTGDTVVYRVRRGDRVRDVRVRLESPLRSSLVGFALVSSGIVAAAFLIIGLFVFTRKPDDARVTVFYALVVAGALSTIVTPALMLDASNVRGIVVDPQKNILPFVAFITAAMAFLPLTLHLALIFPRERPVIRTSPRVLGWVYGIPVLDVLWLLLFAVFAIWTRDGVAAINRAETPLNIAFAVVTLVGLFVALRVARRARTEGVRRAFWNRPLQSLFAFTALFFGLARIGDAMELKAIAFTAGAIAVAIPFFALVLGFPISAIVSLYRSYREAGVEERRQVKWPLWGTLIALAVRLLMAIGSYAGSGIVMLTGGDMQEYLEVAQWLGTIPQVAALLVPISFAFAILKYRLMNIDVIIRKTVVYAILSGAIIVVYLVLVGGLGTLLVNVAGVRNQTMVIASTLVVALLFVPLRNKLQTLVDRNLFRTKYDYPEALRAIGAETLSASDLNAFLASAAEKTQQALQNHAVVIFVNRHDELVAAAKVGVADSLIGALRIRREGFVPMLDRPFDPRRHALPDDAVAALKRVDAVLVVPINTPGTPANGCIALAPKLSGAELDVEDIDFLRSVADQIDLGIDRIRLQREDVDYEQARAIQQTLLPREMPRVAGLELSGIWQPARTMGGDYYDLLKLGENELALCIGDVAGKGMPAALLMSGLQAAVRASASGSPRDLCERVRRVVVSSLAGGRFVTFFYATIDTASMKLRWCNAGHNAPVLARADGSVLRLDGGGPAFSRLTSGDKYEELETGVAPGDRIVLFTDGVSEAGAGADMFGEQRLEELVVANRDADARTLQQRIVAAATTYAGGELEDDLTLVVIAVTM